MSYSQKVEQGHLSFARGLATELTPLSTPEELQGTTSDELNMTVNTEGMYRTRRAGFAEVPSLKNAVLGTVLDVKYWRKASCYVVCSYNPIPTDANEYEVQSTFIDKTDPLKNRQYTTKISVPDFVLPSVCFLRTKCLITYGSRPLLFTREISGEYTIQYINLFIRDFKLLDDKLTVTNRPGFLTIEHKYNLLNAGWYQPRSLKDPAGIGDPVQNFYAKKTSYPSNADVSYLGDITDSNGDLKFDPAAFDNINVGSTEAPRGHYVYDIRSIERGARVNSPLIDGAPSTTLTDLLVNGNDPVSGEPNPGGGSPIDDFYPEYPPGTQIP